MCALRTSLQVGKLVLRFMHQGRADLVLAMPRGFDIKIKRRARVSLLDCEKSSEISGPFRVLFDSFFGYV